MKIDWIHTIILVLAVTAISGCSTPGPVVTPTAAPATATPGPPTPTAASTPSPTSTAPSSASVAISGFSFQPGEVTIAKGGSVTWTNDDSTAHTVRFAGSESDALGKGGTYSKSFDSPGTYDYSCGIHPGMIGKVTVI